MSGHHKLIDPTTGAEYLWPVNHSGEEVNGRARTIRRADPTAAGWDPRVTPIRQQGTVTPHKMRLRGRANHSQHEALTFFAAACMEHTVLFYDAVADETFEAIVTTYQPTRVAVASAFRTGEAQVWDYSIEIEEVNP